MLVSIIIPVYNCEAFLEETVKSVLAQTHQHLELIMVDDGSTDNSPAIMQTWAGKDSRVKLIFQSHGGIARAMNTGINAAQGQFIAYLDQDDVALPGRLATQLDYMINNGIDICGSWAQQFGNSSRLLKYPESHDAIEITLLFYCSLLQPTVMLRADIAKANLYNERANFLDYEMWTRLVLKHRMGNVQKVLTNYRGHTNQTHIRLKKEFAADLIKYREIYFHSLFSRALPQEYKTLAIAAEKKSLVNLEQVDQVGELMSKLVKFRGHEISVWLGKRWMSICRQSSYLGYGVFCSYYRYSSMFPAMSRKQQIILWVTCILRINIKSKAYKLLAQLNHSGIALFSSRTD